jgi:HK97 family phage major capsid protein
MMAMIPDRRMTVRDLLAPGTTSASSVEYVQETGFTNSAGMVAEGTSKPESSLKFDLKTAPVRKIAHWMLASSEILADAPGLQSMIDYRLRYGLEYKEEGQLLNGDGTGQNLLGLIPQATAYSAAFVPSALTAIDTMRLAALQAALAEYPATGHVMHPTDWARIELTKDTQGRYIIGNPQGGLAPTLWGLPVVATQAMTIDKFLTGAFRGAAQVFDRLAATVLVSTEDSDNFRKNLVTILAEERLALAVYRPEAFIFGDLGFVA